jgi:hypothetical protein
VFEYVCRAKYEWEKRREALLNAVKSDQVNLRKKTGGADFKRGTSSSGGKGGHGAQQKTVFH